MKGHLLSDPVLHTLVPPGVSCIVLVRVPGIGLALSILASRPELGAAAVDLAPTPRGQSEPAPVAALIWPHLRRGDVWGPGGHGRF